MRTAALAAALALAFVSSPVAAQVRLPCMPIERAVELLKAMKAAPVAEFTDGDGDVWALVRLPDGRAAVMMLSPMRGVACGVEGGGLRVHLGGDPS